MKNLVVILIMLMVVLTACGSQGTQPQDGKDADIPVQIDTGGDVTDTPPTPPDSDGDQTGVEEPEEVNQADVMVTARIADMFYNIQAIGKYYDDGVTAMATITVDAGRGSPWTGLGGLLAWILEPIKTAYPNSNGDFMVPGVPQEFQAPLPQNGAMAAIEGACPAGAKPNVTFETGSGDAVTPELIKDMNLNSIPSGMLTIPQDSPGSLMEIMNELAPVGDQRLANPSGWNNLLWTPLQEMQTTAESLLDYQIWNASADLEQQIVDIYRQQLEATGVPDMVISAFNASSNKGWYSGTEPSSETALAHMDIMADMTGSVNGVVHEQRDFIIPGGGNKPEFGTQTGDGTVTFDDPERGPMTFVVDILLDEFDEEGRAIAGNVVATGTDNEHMINIIFQPDGSKVGEVYRSGEMVGLLNMSVDADRFENYIDVKTDQSVQMPGSEYFK